MTSISPTSYAATLRSDVPSRISRARTRPAWLPLPFAAATVLPATSLLAGGQQFLTDAGWLVMTALCAGFLAVELKMFHKRFGVGGIVFFGGVLIWFCQDYFAHWFGLAGPASSGTLFASVTVDPALLAKASFYHFLFITFVTVGMAIDWGHFGARLFAKAPQPASNRTLLWVITLLVVIGLMPYALFTTDSFFVALWKDMWSMRSGQGPAWTLGRTGNLNYSWGGYLGQLFQIGRFAGLLAAFFAIFLATHKSTKLFCWFLWLIWFMLAFGSGTRSLLAVMGLPPLAMIFIKHHTQIAAYIRRSRIPTYVLVASLAIILYLTTQVVGYVRNYGLSGIDALDQQTLATPKDNTMFSHTLWVFGNVPNNRAFVSASMPGEGAVRAIPETLFYAAVGIVPRALWRDKPVDPLWAWSTLERGGGTLIKSTTVATGQVGGWYAKYGVAGVIEGALFWSWMLLAFEKLLLFSGRKPLLLVIGLAGHAFLFRSFRGMNWNAFYPIVIAVSALALLALFTRRIPTNGYTLQRD